MGRERGEAASSDKFENLRRQVILAIDTMSSSWDVETQRPEYQDIQKASRDLYQQLAQRRLNEEVRQGPLSEMTYDAAHNLMGAVAYLLDEPLEIASIAPGFDQDEDEDEEANTSVARILFVDKIVNALNHLGLSGDALEEALIKEGLL